MHVHTLTKTRPKRENAGTVIKELDVKFGDGNGIYNWRETNPEHRDAVIRRFMEENPSYHECACILVNCLDMTDPAYQNKIRDHKGTHPETMRRCAYELSETQIKNMTQNLDTWRTHVETAQATGRKAPVCRAKRHRSVGCRQLMYEMKGPLSEHFGVPVFMGNQ